jgi:conjugative transfer signal peptidase TraF
MKTRSLIAVAAAVTALAALPVVLSHSPLRVNYTDSIRPTLLWETADSGAAYIAFCVPEAVNQDAVQAAFAGLPSGECPGGRVPLMKRFVVATPESLVTLGADGFTVGGKLLPNTAAKPFSRFGIALTHYPFGSYSSGIWPISTESADSYDARYFGPISPAAIRYRAKAVFGGFHAHA